MQDAPVKWLAAAAMVVAVASACSGGGGGPDRAARVRTDGGTASVRPSSTSSTSPGTPGAVPPVASSSTTTTSVPSLAAPPAPPVVTVSVAALEGGSISRSDGSACSSISSQSLAMGRLEVRRSGATDVPLTVRYTTAGGDGDFAPLPGSVTIPAGATSAVVDVTPTFVFGPAPQHVHRSSSVSFTVLDDPAYDLGAPATAAVTLSFDVDVFGCDTPTS